MNCQCNIFIYSLVTSHISQQTTRQKRNSQTVSVVSQLLFWLVEILLRMYIVYCQCIYTHIQQFNRKMIVLQGFKLLPCDGVETRDLVFYRLIVTTSVVIALIGGVGKPVWCRCQFPALLHHLTHLVLFRLYLRVHQQYDKVVKAE